MSQELISIILPVHNQADHITEVVAEYEEALSQVPRAHELILVANNCRDNTWEVCQTLAKSHPNVRPFYTAQGGWGLSVKLGLREARGDLICYTNSARTTGQDLTLLLLYSIVWPKVVIKANRKIRESWRRRLGSLFYNLECRALFDLNVWDINGTPKVFPRQFTSLLELGQNGDLIDIEFVALCARKGYPVLEVPVFSSRRHGGKSTTGIRSAFKMYWGAWKLRHAPALRVRNSAGA